MAQKPSGTAGGKAGGKAILQKYGVEHFREIGRKGGAALRDSGTDFASLGKVGGETTKARHGAEYFAEIGRIGGSKRKGSRKARNGT